MTEGERDSFIESDSATIGNYAVGTRPLFGVANRNSRKKRKKARKHHIKSHRRKRRKNKRHTRRARVHKRGGKSGIRYTKNGQPYKIMPNGRARFIKK